MRISSDSQELQNRVSTLFSVWALTIVTRSRGSEMGVRYLVDTIEKKRGIHKTVSWFLNQHSNN